MRGEREPKMLTLFEALSVIYDKYAERTDDSTFATRVVELADALRARFPRHGGFEISEYEIEGLDDHLSDLASVCNGFAASGACDVETFARLHVHRLHQHYDLLARMAKFHQQLMAPSK